MLKSISKFGVLACFLMVSAVQAECVSSCAKIEKQDDRLVITVFDESGQVLHVKTLFGFKNSIEHSNEIDIHGDTVLGGIQGDVATTNEDGGTAPNPDQGTGPRVIQRITHESQYTLEDGTTVFITVFGYFDATTGELEEVRVQEQRIPPRKRNHTEEGEKPV